MQIRLRLQEYAYKIAPLAGMGIKFMEMSQNDNQILKEYLEKTLKDFKNS